MSSSAHILVYYNIPFDEEEGLFIFSLSLASVRFGFYWFRFPEGKNYISFEIFNLNDE